MSATMTTNNDQKTNGAGQADMQTTTAQQAGQATTGRAGWGMMKGLHAGLLAAALLAGLGVHLEAAADEEDPPTVSMTAPANNSSHIYPATLTLAATAHAGESDAHIDKVEFFVNGVEIGEDSTAPYQVSYTPPATGTYTLKARAKDDHNQSTTSATVTVTVVANQAPSVSLTGPAAGSTAIAPAAFTLTANASDADGAIAKVDFYANGALIGTDTSAPYDYAWSNIPVGAYSLTAKATDDRGAQTTSATVAVTVNANQAPTAGITAPAANSVLTAPASLTLAANAADSDGSIARVDFYDGATFIGTATAAPYSVTWNNIATGAHSLTVIATDNIGAQTTSGAVNLTVIAPPAVSLTGPANNTVATAPATFTLTADASSAGSIARVEFYNGAALIGSATTAPYSFTWNNVAAGSYTITAVATDGNGATATSAPISVIANQLPTVGITSPAANASATAPASFTLMADATDSDGTIAKVDFYNGTMLLGTATTAPYSVTWTSVAAGVYTITAIATDNLGATTTSAAVAVTSNQAPSVSLTSPAANAVSVAPGSFTLTADAADVDGSIARVDFHADGVLIGTATTAPYSFTWSSVPAGTHTLTAVATDNLGASVTSAAVGVISDAPPAVSLTSPAANAVSVAPGSFTLTADAASTTSSIAKVDYYASSAGTNTLIGTATAAPYSFDWTNVPAGSYSLTAVATDALGTATTSAAVTVTSDQPPSVTLTGPAAGSQITSPSSFTLTATADSVTSSIAKVEFYADNGTSNTLLGTATTNPYSVTWSNVPVGSYSLTAVATDALGTATTSAAVTVTAIANVPPTVALTGPANGATATVPGSFTLTATAASTTSAVAKVEFYAIDNATNASTLIGTATQVPYTANWSNVPVGSYTLTATATDTLGAQTTSSPVTVTVNTGIAQAYYIHTDHLDTPRTITDSNGAVVWQWDNTDPFGNNMANENPNSQGAFAFNLRFPGQYFDRETNTHYNFRRDYDPATGRYIESDSIGPGGGINTYTYVIGNPLGYTDSTGLIIDTIWDVGNVIYDIWNGNWGDAAADTVAMCIPGVPAGITKLKNATSKVVNPVSDTLARVVPGHVNPTTLGKPGDVDVFVTNASELRGLTSKEIAQKLTIPESSTGFKIIEFPTSNVSGIASPINRTNPGFVGGGKTAGGASEFVIPNGPIPVGSVERVVP